MDFKILNRIYRKLRGPTLASLLIFIAVVGPGLITASVDNDAGGIATYSLAGAQFGYSILIIFIPMTIILAMIQEMGIRMGVVTKQGLESLIRKKINAKITFFLMIALLIANFGNILAEFSGIASGSEIFGVSRLIALPLAGIFVIALVIKENYRKVERVFLLACVLYASYIIAAYLAGPDWGYATQSLFVPNFTFTTAFLIMVIGVIGTTIAPWMQFYIQSSVAEKGVKLKRLKFSQIDAITGSIVTDIIAFFIVVACAATIFKNGIPVNTVVDISLALVPLAGKYAGDLFAFGLLNASLFAAVILPLATAYAFCESLGYESGVSKSIKEAPLFYGIYIGLVVLGIIIVLLPQTPLLAILFYSQVINGILLPFILIIMLIIINDKKIMGKYTNGKIYNIISWIVVIILILISIASLIAQFVS